MSIVMSMCFNVSVKSISIPKATSKLFHTSSVRHGEPRYLEYYRRKLSSPVYEKRKQDYRDKVLQPLETMPTLEQRLKEENVKDPILDARVDIGFPSENNNWISVQEKLKWQRKLRENKELEKQARFRNLKIDLDEVRQTWLSTEGKFHIRDIAEHYGIFHSLFDHGYFVPNVPFNVFYDVDDDCVTPVYMGNILEAVEVKKLPEVRFESEADDLWTIILTNLDGHLLDPNSEYLHWFIGNVRGSDLKTGETICEYLQPFPFRGTGYHRLAFVLYKQNKLIDFSALKRPLPCLSLKQRTFKTFDFYKEHQDTITPAGLSFFQCTWDSSLTSFFHNVLNMREPIFEYKQPDNYYKSQVQYPDGEPFNVYLERHRDPKEIKKEVLLKRLNSIHPFKEEPPMPRFPNLHDEPPRFSWQNDDQFNERLRIGKFRDLRPHSVYPEDDSQAKYPFKN